MLRLSIVQIPMWQLFFGAVNYFRGPKRTVELSHEIARTILDFIPQKAQPVRPEDMVLEMKVINRLTFRPWIACLETACSFEQWLAFHGQSGRIRIGRRMEDGRVLMHAWIETSDAVFFGDDRFEACFETGVSNVGN